MAQIINSYSPTGQDNSFVQNNPSQFNFNNGVNAQGQSYAQVFGTPSLPINSVTLAPTPQIPYTPVQGSPTPSISALNTDVTTQLQPTQPETQSSELVKRLQALNDQTVGKSAYTAEQQTAAGIPELTKTQNDLATQVKQLQNEALAIPQQLQVEATGRGITAGGLAPLQTARLRTNAIAALGVSSLLDATNGLLASANDKVTRAVAAKYDPIQEEINAATANLDLILKDPATTLADKNRAQVQLDIQNKKQATLDQQKADQKAIYDVSLEAAKNGADALTLQKIQNSKTPQEAIQNAGTSLQNAPDTSVVEANGRKLLINSKTGATIQDLGSAINPTSNETTIQKFGTALVNRSELDKAGTREQFIRQLEAQFPTIDPASIQEYVYGTYPDNYNAGTGNASAISYYVKQIQSGGITIDNVPADIRTEVAQQLK